MPNLLPWRLLLCIYGSGAFAAPAVQDGDLIFQTSRSAQSLAIQRATGSRFSHMGVILHRSGQPFVLEAAKTVRATPLSTWIARGEGGHYTVKRLKDADTLLTPAQLTRLRQTARQFEGRPYDLTFAWSDERIYCSELVWKLFERALKIRIGELQRLGDFRLDDPVVRAKLQERHGRNIPLDEPVISPSAMADSPRLTMVVER